MRTLIITLPVCLCVLLIFFPVLSPNLIPLNEEKCGEYCEAFTECTVMEQSNQLTQIPAQPANTWSNFAFILAGLYIIRRRKTPVGAYFGFCCIILGLGSGAFHSYLSKAGQRWDVLGMFLVFNFLAGYAIYVTKNYQKFYGVIAVSLLLSVLLALVVNLSSTLVLGITFSIILVHMGLAVHNRRISWQRMAWTLSPFLVGILFRQLDVNKVMCNPDAFLQGHALWHIFSALGIFLIFRVFEEMRFIDTDPVDLFGGINLSEISVQPEKESVL